MVLGSDIFETRRTRMRRWLTCAMVIVALHAAGAAFALGHWHEEEESEDAAGAVMVELAPIAAAARLDMPDVAPGPQMEEATLTPQVAKQTIEEVDKETPVVDQAPLAPEPEVLLPTPKPVREEKPVELETQEEIPVPASETQTAAAPLTTAPPKIEAKEAAVAVAPQPGASTVPARVLASWQKSLITHLNRYKRYPDGARARGSEGAVKVEFRIDRSGAVLSSRVTAGSGSSLLDNEALSVLQRASPLPAPPHDLSEDALVLTLPIHFRIK